ncbi:hypothetical protein C8Q76DRAFT_753556 [Earliella scabrosa]|nr:hypothetical protein C8Q76DRAFT_753556 [Earliella scabrosa]
MKLRAGTIAVVLSACGLVHALPGLPDSRTKILGTTSILDTLLGRSPKGAVFFMTNEPDENMVVSATIKSDGTLSISRAVASGGRGLHGVSDPPGPDGLFSQGGIKASSKGRVLATVNPGSNTISLFSIDPKDPANITPLGDPISSEGEFPMSLTFNEAGSRLCVLNGGAVASVNCFSVDPKLGLIAIPNSLRSITLNQTTPPNGPPGSASNIVFNHDESKLMASFKGSPPEVPGHILVWDVQQDGSLSAEAQQVDAPTGGSLTFSMTPIPNQNAFLVTDPGVGFTIFDFSGGNRSSAVTIDGQSATCWSTFSPKTGNFFVVDVGTATITEVHVDSDTLQATIVKQFPQAANSGTIDSDVATVGGRDFLYTMEANAQAVNVLALPAPGNARKIATMDISRPARAAGLTINSVNLQGLAIFIRE